VKTVAEQHQTPATTQAPNKDGTRRSAVVLGRHKRQHSVRIRVVLLCLSYFVPLNSHPLAGVQSPGRPTVPVGELGGQGRPGPAHDRPARTSSMAKVVVFLRRSAESFTVEAPGPCDGPPLASIKAATSQDLLT